MANEGKLSTFSIFNNLFKVYLQLIYFNKPSCLLIAIFHIQYCLTYNYKNHDITLIL